jgi:hypothetical protein
MGPNVVVWIQLAQNGAQYRDLLNFLYKLLQI